ncbi:retrovirus-related pol polyprotein from transposon TNT 1-94 [Tanacetum coccineum]
MDDPEPKDESANTPLVSPFLDSDDNSDDGEVLSELEEYGNAGKFCRKKIINSFDGDDLAFQCMIGFRKFVAYFNPLLPMNIITRKAYTTIMVNGLKSTGINLAVIVRDVCVFIGSFTYVIDFVSNADGLSKEVFYVASNSELNVSRFTEMQKAHNVVKARCLELEAELSNLRDNIHKDNYNELLNRFSNLEVNHLNLQLKYQNLKESFQNKPSSPVNDTPDFNSVFVIGQMKASLQGKDNVIQKLKMQISQLKETRSELDRTLDFRARDFQISQLTEKVNGLQEQNELFRAENAKIKQHYKELYDSIKITRAMHTEQITALKNENESLKVQLQNTVSCVTTNQVKPKVLAPGKYAIDVEPIPPRNRNNREVHLVYLRHLKESVDTLREIVEEAKVERPLDRSLAFACRYTKHSQELLEYVFGTCPKVFNQQDKKHAHTPRKKQVTFEDQIATSSNASGSQPRSILEKHRTPPAKRVSLKKVEDHLRTIRSNGNLHEDIQCARFDTPTMMLDRTDFASWQQRIRLYCRGKENGVNILKSIDEGPFQMGTFRETLAERNEGALHLGPERPRVYSDLSPEDKESSLNTERGLGTLSDDLSVCLSKATTGGEANIANENKMMLDRFTQHTVDPLALMSNNVHGRQNRGQRNNAWGAGATGYGGAQNRVGNANPGQARQVKCYNCNGIGHIARNCTQPKHPQNSKNFKYKMLLMQAQENEVALDEEQLLFIAGGQDNAIDEDVDEKPVQDLALNVDNMFQADDYPVYDEAGPSYDSNILSEVHDHDLYQDAIFQHHEEHEMHDDVQPNYFVDSHANYTSDSNMIPYDQYVKDNAMPVVQSNVSSIPNDVYMMIFNDMHEPHAQSVSNTTRNTIFDNSLTAELATYKEQVELYERRARFELLEREQKINEQLRIVITDRNIKEEKLKKELHSVKIQGVAAESTLMENNPFAPVDNDPFINVFAPEPSFEASSSGDLSSVESPYVTQTLQHLRK